MKKSQLITSRAALAAALILAALTGGCGEDDKSSTNLSVTFMVADVDGSASCPTEATISLDGHKAVNSGGKPEQPVSLKETTVACKATFTETDGLTPGDWDVSYVLSAPAQWELAPGAPTSISVGGSDVARTITVQVRTRFRADGGTSHSDAGVPDKGTDSTKPDSGKVDGFVAPDKGAQADSGLKPDTMAPDKGATADKGITPDSVKPDTFVPASDKGTVKKTGTLIITVVNNTTACSGLIAGTLRVKSSWDFGKAHDITYPVMSGATMPLELPAAPANAAACSGSACPGAYWLEAQFGGCFAHTTYASDYPIIKVGAYVQYSLHVY